MIQMTFGQRFKQLRTEMNITQEELAKDLSSKHGIKISKGAISQYEHGKRTPEVPLLKQLAEYFGVPVDYLLGNSKMIESGPAHKIAEAISDDPELLGFWEDLVEREDLQIMFKQVKDLTPQSIKKIIKIIKAFEDEDAAE